MSAVRVTFHVDPDALEAFNAEVVRSGMSRQAAIEAALWSFVNMHERSSAAPRESGEMIGGYRCQIVNGQAIILPRQDGPPSVLPLDFPRNYQELLARESDVKSHHY